MKSPLALIDSLEGVIGHWVIRYRFLIIITSLLVVVLAGLGLPKAEISAGYRNLFLKDDPKILALDELEAEFTKISNALFLIEPKNGDGFTREVLAIVQEMTTEAWQLPYSIRVESITNFQHTIAEGDDLIVGDLVENPGQLSPEEISVIKQVALNEPALRGKLVSEDAAVLGVNVSFHLPEFERGAEIPEVKVTRFVNQMRRSFEEKYPEINLYVTGRVPVDDAFYQVAINDGITIIPISFALMLIIFVILSRSILCTLLTALVISFSIIVAVGTVAHLGVLFHTGNAAAPTIIVTIASASCVHLLTSYQYYRRTLGDNHQAIVESLRMNLQPITLTSFTTAIGFLSILFSDVPAFRVLSVLVTLGIAASLPLVILLLPAILSFMPNKKLAVHSANSVERSPHKEGMIEKLGEFIVNHNRWLFRAMLAIILVTMVGIPRNILNDDYVEYFDESMAFRQATDFATEHLTGIYSIQYGADSGEADGINNPEFLIDLQKFVDWLKQQPEVLHVTSITDTYKRLNKSMHGDDQAAYRLPDTREEAAQYLLLYELSLPYGLDLTNQVNMDKSKTRLIVSVDSLNTKEFMDLDRRVSAWVAENSQRLGNMESLGTSFLFAHKSLSNGRSMIITTSIALVVISLLLILMLRSVRVGLISMVPNLVPAAIGFGIWGFMDGEITIVLSIVMTMTLGIVVDDTVHFLSKYQRARKELGMNTEEAIVYCFKTVGRALVTTSLMLAGGFFVLMQSHYLANAEMGLLTGIIIIAALIADFFFLPPLLIKLDKASRSDSVKKVAVKSIAVKSIAVKSEG